MKNDDEKLTRMTMAVITKSKKKKRNSSFFIYVMFKICIDFFFYLIQLKPFSFHHLARGIRRFSYSLIPFHSVTTRHDTTHSTTTSSSSSEQVVRFTVNLISYFFFFYTGIIITDERNEDEDHQRTGRTQIPFQR